MREIKFRGWFIPEKKYYFGIESPYDGMGDSGFTHLTTFGESLNDENWIVEQFTGLKDKNGKEIYEGDIVQAWLNFGPGGDTQRILPVNFNWYGISLQHWAFNFGNEYLPEIIGNIRQNPELLEC